jgi:biopolymer transport protein ExbD
MTSLIDVIFLLLLFFMLTSTFTRFAEIPLRTGAAGRLNSVTEPHPAFLRLDKEGMSLNGRPTTLMTFLSEIDTLPAPPDILLVSLSKSVTSQAFADLLVVMSSRPALAIKVFE